MDGQPDSMTFKQFHYKKSYLNQIKDGGDRKISPKNRNYAVENLFMRQHWFRKTRLCIKLIV